MLLPFLPDLDACADGASIASLLTSIGAKGDIDNAPWIDTYPCRPQACFAAAHSGTAIYLLFRCQGKSVRATHTAPQSAVSQDSCVEAFIQPKPDSEYWNFEFNCIGAINASHRFERPCPTRLSDSELNLVRRFPSLGFEPFSERADANPWTLAVVIPMSLLGVAYEGAPLKMRANLYACSSASSHPYYLCWSPISAPKPNYHLPEYFAPITLQ